MCGRAVEVAEAACAAVAYHAVAALCAEGDGLARRALAVSASLAGIALVASAAVIQVACVATVASAVASTVVAVVLVVLSAAAMP